MARRSEARPSGLPRRAFRHGSEGLMVKIKIRKLDKLEATRYCAVNRN